VRSIIIQYAIDERGKGKLPTDLDSKSGSVRDASCVERERGPISTSS
jgi:hypothetical protein